MSLASQILGAGGGIKSVQRGTISLTGNNLTATATVSAVDVTKSQLAMLGLSTNSGSANVNSESFTRLSLTNSTTITATRGTAVYGIQTTVSWELTEFN